MSDLDGLMVYLNIKPSVQPLGFYMVNGARYSPAIKLRDRNLRSGFEHSFDMPPQTG